MLVELLQATRFGRLGEAFAADYFKVVPDLITTAKGLTNGVIPIGWHRVVAAPGYEGERYSVVQFCHPRPWTILSPVPSCCTPDHPQRFSAIRKAS